MKPASIERVNGLGKAGYIIANIVKALIIIGLSILLIATIVMFTIPSDLVSLQMNAQADIGIDLGVLGITADQLNTENLNAALAAENVSGSLSIQGMELLFNSLSVDGTNITLSASGSAGMHGFSAIRTILIMALITLAVYLVCTFFIAAFCKTLSQCKSPFEEEVVKKMQVLAWAMLALPFVSSLNSSLSESALSGNIHIQLSIDLMEIILILAMFALSYIFNYGAQLQRESDETL